MIDRLLLLATPNRRMPECQLCWTSKLIFNLRLVWAVVVWFRYKGQRYFSPRVPSMYSRNYDTWLLGAGLLVLQLAAWCRMRAPMRYQIPPYLIPLSHEHELPSRTLSCCTCVPVLPPPCKEPAANRRRHDCWGWCVEFSPVAWAGSQHAIFDACVASRRARVQSCVPRFHRLCEGFAAVSDRTRDAHRRRRRRREGQNKVADVIG